MAQRSRVGPFSEPEAAVWLVLVFRDGEQIHLDCAMQAYEEDIHSGMENNAGRQASHIVYGVPWIHTTTLGLRNVIIITRCGSGLDHNGIY